MEKKEKSNLILSTAGMAISGLGSRIYTFAIGLYVLKLTGSGQSFATTLLLGILPTVILGPFVGNLADRINKKILVVGSDLISGLLMGVLFLYGLYNDLTLPIIYSITFILAILSTILRTGFDSAQRDIVNDGSLTKLSSIRYSTYSIIDLSSPIIGGIIYAFTPIYIFLIINGISFIASAISELFIDFNFIKITNKIPVKNSFMSDMKSGLVYFKKQPILISMAFYSLIINFFFASFEVAVPYFLNNTMKLESEVYGIIMSVIFLGALGGALFIGKKNSRLTHLFLVKYLFLCGFFFIILGLAMHNIFSESSLILVIISISGFLMIASATALYIPLGVFLQTSVDPGYIGRVNSIISSLCTAVMPLGFLFFGFLTEHISPFLIISGCGTMIVFIAVFSLKSKILKTLGNDEVNMIESTEPIGEPI